VILGEVTERLLTDVVKLQHRMFPPPQSLSVSSAWAEAQAGSGGEWADMGHGLSWKQHIYLDFHGPAGC
jgi:hypothetical protein